MGILDVFLKKPEEKKDFPVIENITPKVINFGGSTFESPPPTQGEAKINEELLDFLFSKVPKDNLYFSFYRKLELLKNITDQPARFNTALELLKDVNPSITVISLLDDYQKFISIVDETEKELNNQKEDKVKEKVTSLQTQINDLEAQETQLLKEVDKLKKQREELSTTKTKNEEEINTSSNTLTVTFSYLKAKETTKMNDIKKFLTK